MPTKLSKAAAEFNVSFRTLAAHLHEQGFEIDVKPTSKLDDEMYGVLLKEFRSDLEAKEAAEEINIGTYKQEATDAKDEPIKYAPKPKAKEQEEIIISSNLAAAPVPSPAPPKEEKPKVEAPPVAKETPKVEEVKEEAPPVAKESPKVEEPKEKETKEETPVTERVKAPKLAGAKVISKIDLDKKKGIRKEKVNTEEFKVEKKKKEVAAKAPLKEQKKEKVVKEVVVTRVQAPKLAGAKVVGKIELPKEEKKGDKKPRTRKRVLKSDRRTGSPQNRGANRGRGRGKAGDDRPAVSDKEIQDKIKATMAKLGGGSSQGKSRRDKYRKDKRSQHAENEALAREEAEAQEKILQVTEFIAVNELASLLDVGATDVISKCFSLGIMVSINQRIDAEIIELVASEYGYEVEFINLQEESDDALEEIIDNPEDLVERAPIVTVMGHVDHGKTSLLDYIRETNVIAGESGGITQHIGAYEVTTESGKKVTFLDTPGHEAFTAMRARGAKVTDIAVIVIAADDAVMPQTKEAISHAQAAGVPMIFAINKVDLDTANPDKILEQLSQINVLTESWGGKHQSQNISAKTGLNISELLDKVLLEAEVLELKANPERDAVGTIIEASLDKGKGFVATLLVQSGTLRVGDFVVSGSNYGRIKAMFNERNQKMADAPPSTPAIVLGLDGAPQAGERFQVFESEQEAKALANKRAQILREQGIRTQKHITLDEIGRRLALGNFKELNVIVKGDVDGSIEALSDSLLKLSTEEIQVNVIHKSVGGISESDVLLASASDAIIIGFQVRPSASARKAAETEAVEIRLYSVIYDAIEEVKAAMEGLLEPTFEEKITCNVLIQETYKISRVGTIAGCLVKDGKITRNTKIRLIRDGIVKYEGELESLKRHKDDAKEVGTNIECGIKIKNYNDLKEGDIIEGYEMIEIKRTLK